MQKRDLLAECKPKEAPLEPFRSEFCSRCLNPECTRSLASNSKFDQRVSTWEERLFTQVPRMDPKDPRYPTLAGKNFLLIDAGPVPEIHTRVGSWDDPRDLEKNSPCISEPVGVESLVETQKVETNVQKKVNLPTSLASVNAPSQSGKVLPSPVSSGTKETKDAWAAPNPIGHQDAKIVKPGTTIKLGG